MSLGRKYFNEFSSEFWKEPGNSSLLISYDCILYRLYKLIQSFISWWCSSGGRKGRRGRRGGRRGRRRRYVDGWRRGWRGGWRVYGGNSGGGVSGVMAISAICN